MSEQINSAKKTKRLKNIAAVGALGALTVLFGFTRLGMIPWFSGVSITILHVPVILGTLLFGLIPGTGIGAIFGLTSLIVAATQVATGGDAFFVNPVVSVLPRILIAPAVYFVAKPFQSSKNSALPIVGDGIAAFVGSLVNTILVLGALHVLYPASFPWELIWTAFVFNGLPEAAAAVIICIAVILIWKAAGKNKKSRLNSESEEE